MTIIDEPHALTSPFAGTRRGTRAAANVHGACSVETFPSADALSRTHEDADGFTAYLNRFWPANFRSYDGGVQPWEYTEPYDDWQGVYGADAVGVFYHAGHGGMDGNGVFYAPLGAAWGGSDWVNSTQMQLGNERLRYLFWSTCTSLRVHDGHSPWRTWNAANKGLRMIFGWETVSWDVDVYGRRFWDHWNAGNSFSKAWMNSGWDGGRDQAPSAAGLGASADEAKDRVFNERMLNWGAVSGNWWWWTWYDAARSAVAPPAALQAVPRESYVLRLGALADLRRSLGSIGETTVVGPLARIELAPEGAAERHAARAMAAAKAFAAADRVTSALDLGDVELEQQAVRVQRAAGATSDGSDSVDAHVAGYAVEYRQVVDGVPVVSPESGYVRVHLDAAGSPLSVDVTARPVRDAKSQPVAGPPAADGDPAPLSVSDAVAQAAAAHPGIGPDAEALQREIGYVTDGDTAFLAVQQGYRVSSGDLIEKLVRVTVPLNR